MSFTEQNVLKWNLSCIKMKNYYLGFLPTYLLRLTYPTLLLMSLNFVFRKLQNFMLSKVML